MAMHICSFDGVGPIKRGTSYEAFRSKVLKVGQFSNFEATTNDWTAALYTRLCADPEVEVIRGRFPWMKVKRKS